MKISDTSHHQEFNTHKYTSSQATLQTATICNALSDKAIESGNQAHNKRTRNVASILVLCSYLVFRKCVGAESDSSPGL